MNHYTTRAFNNNILYSLIISNKYQFEILCESFSIEIKVLAPRVLATGQLVGQKLHVLLVHLRMRGTTEPKVEVLFDSEIWKT